MTHCQSEDRTPAGPTAAAAGEISKGRHEPVAVASGSRLPWAHAACPPSDTFPTLLQLSQSQLIERLGAPLSSEPFRLGQRPDEFHVALRNTYPLGVPGNDSIEVIETTWSNSTCRLTVWLHQVSGSWQSFEVLRWSEGTEF